MYIEYMHIHINCLMFMAVLRDVSLQKRLEAENKIGRQLWYLRLPCLQVLNDVVCGILQYLSESRVTFKIPSVA